LTPTAKEIARLSNLANSLARKLRNLAKRVNAENFENNFLLKKAIGEIEEKNF